MQEAIKELLKLGQIPTYQNSTEEILNQYADLLAGVKRPVSEEEAKALITLFSPDDAGELNWVIIHLVETAPNWPPQAFLEAQPYSIGIETLIKSCKNAGLWK